MIREIPAGRTAQLTVLRDGRSQNITVTLGTQELPRVKGMMRMPSPGTFAFRVPAVSELPDVAELGDLDSFGFVGIGQPRLGIDAEDLQEELGAYFGVPKGEGVLVRSVFSDSPAAKAGLRAGDVITSVNGKPVSHVRQLREELTGATEGKALKIGLLRNKNAMTLDVQLPARVKKEIRQRTERTNL
jgi:S1-C subfamily serine protease